MLKYIKLRKSLYSKSKRSTSSPRSIPHDRDTDDIIPTQLVSVQKLINDSLFRQNIYLQNKKHILTCQRWDWLL